MLRTALKPRWLGLLAIVVTVMATFGMLGLWQLNVARDKGRSEQVRAAPTRAVADIAAVLTPHGPFPGVATGRRITATGRYDGSGQVLVAPRRLRGETGYWVVTPFVVRSTGARIAVVRGFVTDPRAAVAPSAATEITMSGTLAPGESPTVESARAAPASPDAQLAALDLSFLVNRWPGDLYNAFVFATVEQPDVTAVASPALRRVPPPALAGGGLSWRNAAYALQWWVFALFAGYMWWRMVRDEYEDGQADHHRAEQPPRQPLGFSSPGETGKATNV
ncbi:MAG TPA: SURF1 family protein [Dermatophilaceae bacterium]